MTTTPPLRYSGVSLDKNIGGLGLSVGDAVLMIPDPDEPSRIIVVPVAAARLVFCPAARGAKAVVPEGW